MKRIILLLGVVAVLAVVVGATDTTLLNFSVESDWVQEDATAGTDFADGVVKLSGSVCPASITVTHTAGTVAPVTKTITYGIIASYLSGSNKCWITQNLGAAQQAASATDSTEASAGWYWQFNRKQGFKHDGTTRTPSTTWLTTAPPAGDWNSANDPCTLLLGTGWRIPTNTEWTNADRNGGWTGYTSTFGSVLKLHTAGSLYYNSGSLKLRGYYGRYYSSSAISASTWSLYFGIDTSNTVVGSKTYGKSVRCLKDIDSDYYPTTQAYYITTAAGSQVDTSTWTGMAGVSITQTTPTDTSIKYLVSFDDRNTWKYWNGSSWAASSLANLQTDGMTKIVLESINESQWSFTGGFVAGTLDFAIDMGTTNPVNTPELSEISINYSTSTIPIYSNFEPHPDTTNFSEETNLTDVKSMTLAIEDQGKIKFADDYGINAESEDYDTNIVIEDGSISINTSALDSTFNSSATLTFYSVDCNSPLVYYSDTATTRYNILAEDNQCLAPRCTNIQCSDNTLTVDVEHFSGYAVSGSVNLTIDANDPKFVLEDVTFTAIYMNLTGGFIAGATCNISFADGSYIMDEQADHYNYTKAFAAAQTVDYNVTCSKSGYNTVFANDTAIINEIPVPEFSMMTLGLGLIAVLIGLFVIRRKR